jgi:hypothetical protein
MEVFSITQLKKVCKMYGNHFFSKGATGFFRSRCGENIYKGKYFITSEQREYNLQRLYTIREFKIVREESWEAVNISTVGEFQQFKSYNQAQRYIEKEL